MKFIDSTGKEVELNEQKMIGNYDEERGMQTASSINAEDEFNYDEDWIASAINFISNL